MLANRNQPIVAGLLGVSIAGIVGATALPFNDRIEYRIGNRIESQPAWLVPAKAEFRSIERGYGGIKILLSLLATGGMVTVMLIARKEGELEPMRQRIKGYKQKAQEFDYAAESAYQMARTQQQYKTLLEADDVAFQGEIEQAYCESLGIDPRQQQGLLTGTATLESISNPGDKVESSTARAIEPEQPEQTDGPKIPKLIWYPSVLVYGAPGSGKTFFSEQEVSKRIEAGHRVIVLDPHAAYGAWQGCEVIGGGMDYAAIDAKLAWFSEEVAKRYKTVQSQPNPKFQPLTFVCDEFTRWGGKCPNSTDFFEQLVTDIRKVEMFGLIISHTRTLAGLANAKGFASLRDEALLEVEILGNKDEETGRATPRFEAKIKLPGQPLSDRTLVKLTKHSTPNKPEATPQNTPAESTTDYLNRVFKLEFDLGKPETESETVSDEFQNVKQPHSSNSSDSDAVYFTALKLDRARAIELILKLKNEMKHTQTEIIWMLWNARPGKTKAYETAISEYKELLAEGEEGNAK
ncbi:type IV secretory system conjugative DNA transfer family protein [Microcoleus vaginatus GB2-A3]|uniref:type IV secretory system conjugative DNA transfer family protein n=1 Tax=Microcoleus vaginatus TaxID=119532 RepID=UPI0032A53B09